MTLRCPWAGEPGSLMCRYHDEDWGMPVHDERALFELLCLEGAQAGLSWQTILQRRDGYREAFDGFEIARVAGFGEDRAAVLLQDARIIRNRAKVRAFIDNARATLRLQDTGHTLDDYLWSFIDGKTLMNRWNAMGEVPAETEQSRNMSRSLKKLGFRFVGPTICYAFMQSAGMVNDHLTSCFRHAELNGAQ